MQVKGFVAAAVVVLLGLVGLPILLLMVVTGADDNPNTAAQESGGLVCSPGQTPGGRVAGYGPDQLAVAAGIMAASTEMHLPQQAAVIATATAMQESGLRSIPHGDAKGADSRGPFQQRASWGPEAQRMDPKGSARLFFQRLVAIPNWQTLPLTQAAQAVQVSAFPDAYKRHEGQARQVVGAVQGLACPGPTSPSTPNPHAAEAVSRALSQVGVPYAWGGGNAQGPTPGRGLGSGVTGYDGPGLAQFAYALAGVQVPRQPGAIWDQGGAQIHDRDQLQPGDLVLSSQDGTPGGIHHVGIYLGHDSVVDAPQPGQTVRVLDHVWQPQAVNASDPAKAPVPSPYAGQFFGAVRPGTTSTAGKS